MSLKHWSGLSGDICSVLSRLRDCGLWLEGLSVLLVAVKEGDWISWKAAFRLTWRRGKWLGSSDLILLFVLRFVLHYVRRVVRYLFAFACYFRGSVHRESIIPKTADCSSDQNLDSASQNGTIWGAFLSCLQSWCCLEDLESLNAPINDGTLYFE